MYRHIYVQATTNIPRDDDIVLSYLLDRLHADIYRARVFATSSPSHPPSPAYHGQRPDQTNSCSGWQRARLRSGSSSPTSRQRCIARTAFARRWRPASTGTGWYPRTQTGLYTGSSLTTTVSPIEYLVERRWGGAARSFFFCTRSGCCLVG